MGLTIKDLERHLRDKQEELETTERSLRESDAEVYRLRAEKAQLRKRAKHDWERGFFCVMAQMLQMDDTAEQYAREMFGKGGDPKWADPEDKEIFKQHGLM